MRFRNQPCFPSTQARPLSTKYFVACKIEVRSLETMTPEDRIPRGCTGSAMRC
jgi:hypothetical protein